MIKYVFKSIATLKCPRHCCRAVAVFVPFGFMLNPVLHILIFLRGRIQEKADSQLSANLPFTLKNWRREHLA